MVYFLAIIAYLIVLIAVGAIRGRNVTTQEDFAVAGRQLSIFVLFGTLLATWIGTGSVFGNAEKTYNVGISALILVIPSVLGIIVLAFLAGRVRRLELITVQDILETRYNSTARIFGAIALIIAYITILSYQYRAAGALLNLTLPALDLKLAIILAAIFIIIYTALAGMFSVAYTDVVMGVTMIVGMLVTVPVFYAKVGGLDGLATKIPASHMELFGPIGWVEALGLVLPSFLLILGDANMYQRFFSAKSENAATKATILMLIGVGFMESIIIIAAWLGSGLEPGLELPARVIPFAARDHLPVALGALMMMTIMAIIVSTAIAYLLVPSTVVIRDIYQRFINKNASQRKIVVLSRIVVVVLGIAGYGLSTLSGEFLAVALLAYTIYGAAITPSLIAAFFWKRATAAGAVSSILAGTAVTIIWKFAGLATKIPEKFGWNTEVDAVLPAALISIGTLVIVSLMTPRPTEAQLKPFWG